MRKKPRKPVGVSGAIWVTSAGPKFQTVPFPETKEEIEAYIAQSFSSQVLPGGLVIRSIHQNKQNDFDFTVKTSEGSKFLELMEIAPLENLRGSYELAPSTYKPYDFAGYILAKVLGKSSRYAGVRKSKIVLLLYVTDWSFSLSETTISLLQFWLTTNEHCFEYVFLHEPTDTNSGKTHILAPTRKTHWLTFDPESYRDNEVRNLSPLGWHMVRDDG